MMSRSEDFRRHMANRAVARQLRNVRDIFASDHYWRAEGSLRKHHAGGCGGNGWCVLHKGVKISSAKKTRQATIEI